jgi:hypothetical protein
MSLFPATSLQLTAAILPPSAFRWTSAVLAQIQKIEAMIPFTAVASMSLPDR